MKKIHLRSIERKRGIFYLILLYLGLFLSKCNRNFNRIWNIIIKNIKVLIRSKSSALIIIFGPLIIISLVGVAFNTSTIYDVHIGVYSEEYSELSNSIIKDLELEKYLITKIESKDLCLQGVKTGEQNICLVFSKDMAVGNNQNNKITFYVDYTRVNLVYKLMDDIGQKLNQKSEELSLEMTGILLNELQDAKATIASKVSVLGAVSTNAGNIQTKITSAKEGIKVINLTTTPSKLQLNNVEEDLTTLIEYLDENNVSSSRAENLNKSMFDFKINLLNYLNITKDATNSMKLASDTLIEIGPTLKSDKTKLDNVKEELVKVSEGIASIKVTNSKDIVAPITTSVQPIVTADTHLSKMFPTFLILVIMFVGIMLAATLVLNEKNANATFRNFITPTNDIIFIIGTYITSLLIMAVQLLIVSVVGLFFLSKEVLTNFAPALYPLFVISSLFIFVGICVGYLFNSTETSTLASLFLVSVGLFFSNTLLPLESIPKYLQHIISYNPFVLAESVLKKVLLFGFNISEVADTIWIMWGIIIGLLILSFLFMKIYKRKINR